MFVHRRLALKLCVVINNFIVKKKRKKNLVNCSSKSAISKAQSKSKKHVLAIPAPQKEQELEKIYSYKKVLSLHGNFKPLNFHIFPLIIIL